MAEFVGHPFVQALAWTLVHFLWQGAAIAVVARLLMRASQMAWTRYAIGVGALAAMLVAPVVTLFVQLSVGIVSDAGISLSSVLVATQPANPAAVDTATPGSLLGGLSAPALAAVVAFWLVGVAVFSVRLAGGWLIARRVARQAVRPAAAEIQRVAAAVAGRLGVRRAVTVLESSIVAVPVLVGWMKPVIVLPAAALAGLTPDQLESLIAHELAHVRRHDFLINLLQSVVEALLFYHPAVWWISRRVRTERELCCDDVAVGVCDRLVYAEALKDLAAIASPRLALAATDGDLLSRIRRVLGQTDNQAGQSARWVPIAIVVATLAVAVPATFVIAAPAARDQVRAREASSRLEATRVVDRIPATEVIDVQESQAAQVERELTRRKQADYEALLREYEALLARYQSEGQAERIREAYERAMANASLSPSQIDEAYAKAIGQTARDQERRTTNAEEATKRELERARAEIERTRKLFERGLISESQMKEMEAKVHALSQEHVARQHLVEDRLQDRHRAEEARAQELRQHRERMVTDREDLKRAAEEMSRRARAAEMDARHLRAAELDARRPQAEHTRATMVERERASERGMTRVEGTAAAGDLLEVRIANEPELPTHYEVRSDGTIRVPFLGSFKVAGQTAAQVQASIGKQMSDRKLGSANQVTVSVMRRR